MGEGRGEQRLRRSSPSKQARRVLGPKGQWAQSREVAGKKGTGGTEQRRALYGNEEGPHGSRRWGKALPATPGGLAFSLRAQDGVWWS